MAHFQSDAKFLDLEEPLHEAAAEAVGLADFGDGTYREALRVLLDAYDREAKFTAAGRLAVRHQLLEILKKRLRAEKMWRERPAVREAEVRRPLVILGLVRTGSTALHYLMSQDPDLDSLPYWLACYPQPRPPREEWESRPDFRRAAAEIEAMYAADASLRAIHFMRADLAEECRHLLAQSFTDDGFEVLATVPSYSAWYESQHLGWAYARHRQLVQLIGSTQPGRRWLFKYPVHMRQLDSLLEAYPDACVVQTHRDPATVMRSYVSLVAGFRALYETEVDRRDIARRQLEIWAAGAERAIEVRRGRSPAQFFDLYYADFVADPVGSVERIYRHFGDELGERARTSLARWQDENPPARHGKHEYGGEGLGLTDDEIRDRFSKYMRFFGLAAERRPR